MNPAAGKEVCFSTTNPAPLSPPPPRLHSDSSEWKGKGKEVRKRLILLLGLGRSQLLTSYINWAIYLTSVSFNSPMQSGLIQIKHFVVPETETGAQHGSGFISIQTKSLS